MVEPFPFKRLNDAAYVMTFNVNYTKCIPYAVDTCYNGSIICISEAIANGMYVTSLRLSSNARQNNIMKQVAMVISQA